MVAVLVAGTAHAHGDHGTADGGFISGFLHPLFGWDHIVAMVAVGPWGAVLGPPALWLLPVIFPVVMALGGALGISAIRLSTCAADGRVRFARMHPRLEWKRSRLCGTSKGKMTHGVLPADDPPEPDLLIK
ncbi:HupE/UreJ family protein [Ovoidimarina sediminis]|uniref:HupE/UreJ family protein n=1 Tax=Ovoidimarina sediminis TaxID=3079856 RepID=UPI00290C8AF9|nr:HupE/UreJ family protein [Rhodophyticola sp. MJ-SS7]MDU8944293.1 HupE/UreJ family protein [Rhodophyticola sp. MJ-SS7]